MLVFLHKNSPRFHQKLTEDSSDSDTTDSEDDDSVRGNSSDIVMDDDEWLLKWTSYV